MTSDNIDASPNVEEYAYYVSDWIWPGRRVALMKSMLLFFDKITLALPENLVDETISRDPELAVPLAEKGLLVNMDPSNFLDEQTASKLAEALTTLVTETDWRDYHISHVFSASHYGDIRQGSQAVDAFETVLKRRGLMQAIRDQDLVQLDPRVRLLVLTMYAQVFRSTLLNRGIIVHPLTDSSELARELELALMLMEHKRKTLEFTHLPIDLLFRPMYSDQLSADLLDVGADLCDVPLDEVLDFRRENMAHYVAYAAGLRGFLGIQAALHPAEQKRAQQERRLQIQEQAAELRKISRSAFGIRSATLLFSLIGAAWTAKHGDIFGSMMAGLTASAQAVPVPEPTVTSYSYILKSSRIR